METKDDNVTNLPELLFEGHFVHFLVGSPSTVNPNCNRKKCPKWCVVLSATKLPKSWGNLHVHSRYIALAVNTSGCSSVVTTDMTMLNFTNGNVITMEELTKNIIRLKWLFGFNTERVWRKVNTDKTLCQLLLERWGLKKKN